jgi:hypothetical protein
MRYRRQNQPYDSTPSRSDAWAKCRFPNATSGKYWTQEPQHYGTDLVMHIEALRCSAPGLHLRVAGKFGGLALKIREQSVATASGHDMPEVGALLRHAADGASRKDVDNLPTRR